MRISSICLLLLLTAGCQQAEYAPRQAGQGPLTNVDEDVQQANEGEFGKHGAQIDFVAARSRSKPSPQVAAVATSGNQFALDLYAQLRSSPGNLFVSPNSISTALAMTSAGAAGQTEGEMARVLHFNMPPAEVHAHMQTLQQLARTHPTRNVQLNVANRLWAHQGESFHAGFLQVTRDHYQAELAQLDFSQPDVTARTINSWVANQTSNKITQLISPDSISPAMRLVLTNAIYFKGNWDAPFQPQRTSVEDFHLTTETAVKVPLMRARNPGRFAELDELQVLELPYEGDSLSMVILLPKQVDGLSTLEAGLTMEKLQHWLSSLREQEEVNVGLPKFKLTSRLMLKDALAALGMVSAFDPERADFSRMSSSQDIVLSEVIHQAYVDINEAGTEAAGATAVLALGGEKPPSPNFQADHPFVFLIRDQRSGAILFLGRLTDPSSS